MLSHMLHLYPQHKEDIFIEFEGFRLCILLSKWCVDDGLDTSLKFENFCQLSESFAVK
jgi:hypothetical protein